MNKAIYEESKALAMELGFDLSDKGIIESTQLPPVEKWKDDKKLSGFLDLYKQIDLDHEDENIRSNRRDALKTAIKISRSASIGARRGNLLEQAVEALARREGCTVEKNVRMNEIADESIDYVITLKSGEKRLLMCQIDLWGGGAQSLRACSYLKNDKITLIVYNYYDGNKKQKGKSAITRLLFKQAYDSKKLMWLSDLNHYIREDNEKLSRL